MEASTAASQRPQDEQFGWQLVHDRQHNLVFYLHSHTGEVRWLPPRQAGFVMHGMRPLPVSANCQEPEDWSPYFPHVVVTPSGLLPVHDFPEQDSGAEKSTSYWEEAADRPIGPFNRFPLRGLGVTASGQRILPPTWEDYRDAPPFLPPYPVVVLPASAATFEAAVQQELASLLVDLRVSQLHRQPCPKPACVRGVKEHNRKGYMLRQARKLMKELGELPPPPQAASAPGSASSASSADPTTSSPPLSCADSIPRRSSSPQSVTSALWC